MKRIATFYTWFWILYFPTCIAYNDLPGFSSIDEVMTVVLIVFTFLFGRRGMMVNRQPWKEYYLYWVILAFYLVYSLIRQVNVPQAAFLDLVQWVRPFSVIYCTWILNPQFTQRQTKMMLGSMVFTLVSWILYHPVSAFESETGLQAEFPVLGQFAMCCGMSWYLFTSESPKNRQIAVALALSGLIAPKMKYVGEVVCFVGLMYIVKKKLDFRSPKTVMILSLFVSLCLAFTWTRFDQYYVSGWENEELARPMTYKTGFGKILWDYLPFGPGMGTFATNGAWKYYSPLYPKYELDEIWGLDAGGGFICDAFYPTLCQFGIVGIVLFYLFWKKRILALNQIRDLKCYRVAVMAFFCLAIEQTADSSFLSGKGMGFCMLVALSLNVNKNRDFILQVQKSGNDDLKRLFRKVNMFYLSGHKKR